MLLFPLGKDVMEDGQIIRQQVFRGQIKISVNGYRAGKVTCETGSIPRDNKIHRKLP